MPNNAGNDVFKLKNIESETLAYVPDPDNIEEVIIGQFQAGHALPVPLDRRWIVTNVNEGDGSPYGRSILASLPFVAEIMVIMEEALKKNYERFGVPNFHVNWEPPADFNDPSGAKTAAIMKAMEGDFVKAMKARKKGEIRDFFSAGKVSVKIVGAEGQLLDFVTHGRSIMEQIVGATGLPSWMLGFTW